MADSILQLNGTIPVESAIYLFSTKNWFMNNQANSLHTGLVLNYC